MQNFGFVFKSLIRLQSGHGRLHSFIVISTILLHIMSGGAKSKANLSLGYILILAYLLYYASK